MRTLNLGILAHVDAGKTSLTERLLDPAGVIDTIGRVDDGNTQTDTLALERARGITIKSAVVSFRLGTTTINLIDTPGHPDFIAEVERVLTVLDGAILLISAVEGIQAQTRILMRTLQRLHIPTLLFINKIDRPGAQHDHVLHQITDKLTPAILPMGTTDRLGSRTATFTPYEPSNADFTDKLAERAAEHDDTFLAAYLDDKMSVPYTQLRQALATQTKQAQLHPVFFGSAVTGAGIEELSAGITEFLPATEGDINAPVSGTVFKVERGPGSEKIAYARMFGGQARVRDRLPFGQDNEGKITAIRVFDNGTVVQRSTVAAGQIAKLWGLGDIQIGDPIGTSATTSADHYFAPPTLETVVTPDHPGDKGALHTALTQLAEQDPLINLRQNDVRQEISVSLYGEVQKEVIQTTLADDYHLNVTFRETTTICIERPTGVGAAFELLGIHNFSPHQNTLPTVSDDPNPFLASVGLRIEPAPVDTGVEFRLEIELHGTMPPSFFKAVEETVKEALQQGLCGWQVTDCIVYMTHSGYVPRQSHSHGTFDKSMSSTAGDFRLLTPLVLMNALKRAGTAVYEPMHRFTLEMPADLFGPILPVLGRLRAIPRTPTLRGASYLLEGDIPAAQVHELEQLLPALTRGEGVLESAFDHYQLVAGTVPNRPRTDHNPLNRKEYLLHVLRRV